MYLDNYKMKIARSAEGSEGSEGSESHILEPRRAGFASPLYRRGSGTKYSVDGKLPGVSPGHEEQRKPMRSWRWFAPLLLAGLIALAPSFAEARAGASVRSGGSTTYYSQGSRGYQTYEPNGGAAIQRSTTPQPGLGSPSYAPAYGGSFAQRHPFLTGIAGGFFGSWLGS